jgi:hypothetical protein
VLRCDVNAVTHSRNINDDESRKLGVDDAAKR